MFICFHSKVKNVQKSDLLEPLSTKKVKTKGMTVYTTFVVTPYVFSEYDLY